MNDEITVDIEPVEVDLNVEIAEVERVEVGEQSLPDLLAIYKLAKL
ncbi:hypothetical protein NYR60_03070 [Actinobacillus genomosp. 2]|nr:hypothetical protein [Actinobacillus genomosp. 2]WGE32607.1 hypothetical protein NYR60_03070 [Actinobacillus genomosp. 2]